MKFGIIGGLLLALTAAASDWSREVFASASPTNLGIIIFADTLRPIPANLLETGMQKIPRRDYVGFVVNNVIGKRVATNPLRMVNAANLTGFVWQSNVEMRTLNKSLTYRASL